MRVLPGRRWARRAPPGPASPRTTSSGAYGQERLRASYAVDERATDPDLWYFESFAGRSATDTPLAVFEELRRRRPELEPAWGILDHGHWTPPGSRPVVIGSREWYDVLGTARVLVTNTELEEWYRRRPDQLVVQCFHGYPSKAMGGPSGEARELPPRRVAVMRRRSVETWDLISTPTPGDDGGLPRAVRLRRSRRRARLSPQRRAAGRGRRRRCATERVAASAYAPTRRPCSTPPRGVTTSPPARARRRWPSTSTWMPPRPPSATPT